MKFILAILFLFNAKVAAQSYQSNRGQMIVGAVGIGASSNTSAVIETKGMALVGIKTPAAFTGTTLTFTMCDTIDGTYVPVRSTASGTALSQTVTTSNYYAIDPTAFQGIPFLKIVSGSTEASARTLVYSLKGL